MCVDKDLAINITCQNVGARYILSFSDGLTVPFALAAGCSETLSSTNLVVTAGMAEINSWRHSDGLSAVTQKLRIS